MSGHTHHDENPHDLDHANVLKEIVTGISRGERRGEERDVGVAKVVLLIVVGIGVAAGFCWVVYASASRVTRDGHRRLRGRLGGR
jgi:hypothetical protein